MMSQISLEISKTNWRLKILFGIVKTKHCWLDFGGIALSESSVKLMSQIWLENCENQIAGSWNGFRKCSLQLRETKSLLAGVILPSQSSRKETRDAAERTAVAVNLRQHRRRQLLRGNGREWFLERG
jgi:hypothetical protein